MSEYEDIEVAPTGDEPVEPVQPTAETPAPTESEFNAQDYGVVYRGETVYPKDKQHMNELLQMGHSYSNNKDKYTGMETNLSTLQGQLQQYEALNSTLKEHPELANQFESTYTNYMKGLQQQQQPQQGAVPPEVDGRISQIESKLADDALNTEMNQVMSKYPSQEWNKDTGEGTLKQQLLKFMHKHSITNPEFAYRAFMFPTATQQAQFSGAEQATNQIQKQHRAGVVAQGTAAKPAAKPWDHRGKTYDDAEQSALQELGLK